jgi:tryptophanyl-tRNA synthetase
MFILATISELFITGSTAGFLCCHFFIADWHALTTGYADTADLRTHTISLIADFLAVGLDPEKSVLFLQSQVPEHAELFLLFAMNTPLSWLERCPTYKDQIIQLREKDLSTYGFLGYPCLQAADILAYKADFVPVGEDQLPHLELTREIARRFNHLYQKPVFPEPQPLLTKASALPGTDGRKMSKSYGNTITFADDPETVRQKVMNMVTDPARIRKTDPGHPDVCSVFAFHKIFSPEAVADIRSECAAGRIGCVACKKNCAARLAEFHTPIYERRVKLLQRPDNLRQILAQGSAVARKTATETLAEARDAVRIGL